MSTTQTQPLTANGHELDLSPEHFGWMRNSAELLGDMAALRQRIAEDGYLLMRGLLNRDEVIEARQEVARRLLNDGVIDPDAPLMDCVVKAGAQSRFRPEVAVKNAALEKVLYSGPMMAFFGEFFDEPARHYDFTWFRAIAPGFGTRSHLDVVYMGRAETQRLFTAWTPVGDVDLEQGGLMILEGSNRNQRLRETYGAWDVDGYCINHDGQKDGWARGGGGMLGPNANQIRKSIGGRWLTCPDYRMGDVLIFTVYTIHASLDNKSNRIRLSSDSRYQPASTPADERWVGENPVAHGKAGKRGRIC